MKRVNPHDALAARVATAGTQKQVAEELGISQVYLSDLMRGKRSFSKAILAKLGLEQAIIRSEQKSA